MDDKIMYRYRLLCRIVMEASTPLAVGSGQKSIFTDATVARDANGLPYIPGSSIAGVIRHALKSFPDLKHWMGFQEKGKGVGSKLAVTDARILRSNGVPADGLIPDAKDDPLLSHYLGKRLPIRQHVRLTHRGAADSRGKFDEEVIPKGTRFCFEMELLADEMNAASDTDATDPERLMKEILRCIQEDSFRLGGGTRSGFGAMKIVSIRARTIDLSNPEDRKEYLNKSSRLDREWDGFRKCETKEAAADGFIRYTLHITPDDFMFFGSGFGNKRADMTYVSEPAVTWESGTGTFEEKGKLILIPASSVKGALSHRTAYYYNKFTERFADGKDGNTPMKPEQLLEITGYRNTAVRTLFGSEGDGHGKNKARGKAIFSDVIIEKPSVAHDKILNHVSIDRFTGGAINGALFDEETLFAKGTAFTLKILVSKEAADEPHVLEAFEKALDDVCSGLLPLGGATGRGNGTFTGPKPEKE